MQRHTISDVADALQVEKDAARGLVKFLETVGLARPMGERPPVNGLGRAEKVYEMVEGYEGKLCDLLEAAKLSE